MSDLKTVATFLGRIDGRIVLFRSNYLVSGADPLAELNLGFGLKAVEPARVW